MNFFSFLFGRGNGGKKADSTYLLSEDAKRAAAWIETTNPLLGMTASRMQALYDASRNGDTVHLQWLYNEIEKSDPTLLICASRRRGALASLDWSVKTRSENRMRNFDKVLAGEQVKAVEAAFGEAELGGFNDAMEHLAGAFFRGFAHVLPKWSADGLVIEGFETLDNWNFVRDLMTGTWYWNPEANAYTDYDSCRPIPQGELLTMVTPYHIDYPMLTIYLRQAVGEKGWAKFTERFGIPPVILTMPSDIPSDQVEMWRAQAEKVAEGGSGAVPAGTQVNFCDGARGINPFKDFIHNQRELTVLMATGGLLTSLAQSGSGTLAGGAHSDTWAEVRRMDSAKIASALNAQIVKPLLSRAFPGKAQLVYFDFDTEATPSPGEVFEDAAKARSAGYLIDQAELEEKTGYKLVKDAPHPMPGMGGEVALNKDTLIDKTTRNDPGPSGSGEKGDHDAILKAFAEDSSAAAGEIRDLLENPSPEKAAALLQKLPELLPEDPAMAAVIAEAMAAEFGTQLEKNSECRAQNPATCRTHGTPVKASPETVKNFLANPPDIMTEGEVDSILTTGFDDTDADGNKVKYGELLRDHINRDAHSEKDRIARKKRFGIAVKVVRAAKPQPSKNPLKPNERVYMGLYNGKAYIAVADEHNEIEAMEMVSYRRDSRKDQK
jgi:phage gp29-like protein